MPPSRGRQVKERKVNPPSRKKKAGRKKSELSNQIDNLLTCLHMLPPFLPSHSRQLKKTRMIIAITIHNAHPCSSFLPSIEPSIHPSIHHPFTYPLPHLPNQIKSINRVLEKHRTRSRGNRVITKQEPDRSLTSIRPTNKRPMQPIRPDFCKNAMRKKGKGKERKSAESRVCSGTRQLAGV
jgi:hypothetical protein